MMETSSNSLKSTGLNERAISVFVLALIALFLGFSSHLLSHDNEFGITSILLLFFGGIFVTNFAKNINMISNYSKWIYGFTFYLIASYLVFLWSWYFPLTSLGYLRTEIQMPEYQDANYYDYLAAIAAASPYSDWPTIINSTWLSQGVVAYLGTIYKLMGTSQFNFFFINILLGYISVIFLQGLIDLKRSNIALAGLLSPFVLYYYITPGKEVITNVFTYATLFFIYRAWCSHEKISYRLILTIAILIISLCFIRINAALMLLSIFSFYVFLHTKNKFLFLLNIFMMSVPLVLFLFYIGLDEIIFIIIDINSHMSQLDLRLQNTDTDSLKYKLAVTLTSENLFIHLLLAPFRMIIWLVAPFPFLNLLDLTNKLFSGDNYVVFRSAEVLARTLSSLIMVYFCIRVLYVYSTGKFRQMTKSANFLLFILIGFALILSTTNFIEGARYRTLIEPLAICWIMMTHHAIKLAKGFN